MSEVSLTKGAIDERTESLRRTFTGCIKWVDPDDAREAREAGWISPYRLTDSHYNGADYVPYVMLESVACDEDSYGQASSWVRSNYRRLVADYPDVFTPVSYTNTNGLGAFVTCLSEELADVLCGLQEQYPIYDESDLSDLEYEEITESWDRYARSDFEDDLPDESRQCWELFTEDERRDLIWAVISDHDLYPEHTGVEVSWNYAQLHKVADGAIMDAYARAMVPACEGQLELLAA